MFLKRGDTGKEVEEVQEALLLLGFISGKPDSIFGQKTEAAVVNFQKKNKIITDGIVGPSTINEINKALKIIGKKTLKTTKPSKIIDTQKKLRWVKCKADIFPGRGGYSNLTLRSDTAEAYNNLRDDVVALGGIMTTAGGKRSLESKSSPSRSRKSMHYVGRAFDLALPTGMQDASTDPFIVTDAGNRNWEVWCRTDDNSVPEITLEAVIVSGRYGKTKMTKVATTDRFFSFTKLAEQHGFFPIRARKSFFRGGSYTGAEWWHFQYENGLVKRKTTFGEEILKSYTIKKAESFIYWKESKDCIFGINWF